MLAYLQRHHIALIALFFALCGTSYAAFKLPKASVGTKHLRTGAVTSAKVKDGSLLRKDLAPGQLLPGPAGPTGIDGAAGPQGIQGLQGVQGPSGVVHAVSINAIWSPATLLGNNGSTITTPTACRSAPYTAGAGEAALVTMSATATPSNPAADVLYVNAMLSTDGGGFTIRTLIDNAESMSDGTANASTQILIPLEANRAYRFGVGLSSNSSVAISTGYCSALVIIYKAA